MLAAAGRWGFEGWRTGQTETCLSRLGLTKGAWAERWAASVVLLGLCGPLLATAAVEGDSGNTLAQAAYDRPTGQDLTTQSRMELLEKGRTPRVRVLVSYRARRAGGEVAHLIRFTEPADVAGIGLLSLDKAEGGNEQWLYLPALDRVRRVAGDRKGGRFAGSELYYEDLQDRHPNRDRHRLAGRDMVDGVPCELLESVPIDKTDSVYRKRISCIDRQTALALRVDYFEHDDNAPSKRWLLVAKKRHKSYWTVIDSRMIDLSSGRETRMVVEEALYDRKLPAKLFTSQALADEQLEAEHRP
jgi:hypothetical protein